MNDYIRKVIPQRSSRLHGEQFSRNEDKAAGVRARESKKDAGIKNRPKSWRKCGGLVGCCNRVIGFETSDVPPYGGACCSSGNNKVDVP